MTDINEDLVGVLRWEVPPGPGYVPSGPRRRPWPIVARELRDNPGEWGVVLEDGGSNAGSTVARINGGQTRWFGPAGAYFSVQRTINGRIFVYAVYVGENHEYAEKADVQSVRAA